MARKTPLPLPKLRRENQKYRQTKQAEVAIKSEFYRAEEREEGSDGLKIGRRVDLRRRVIALEGALEGRAAGQGAAGLGLALDGAAVVHQAVVLLLVLLATPDPPGDQRQTTKNDGAAHADHHTDDRVACLRRHARLLLAVVVVARKPRGFRRDGLAGEGNRRTI